MIFVIRKGHEMPFVSEARVLVWLGCEMARTGPLLLLACNMLRLDFVASDSSCTPLCDSLMFRFLFPS